MDQKSIFTMYTFLFIFLQCWINVSPQRVRGKSKTGKPGVTSPLTTMRKHYFEGVDWQLHQAPNKERHDCYGHYVRCVRRTTPLIPVCGYDVKAMYLEDYYCICEIEIENCLHRVINGIGIYKGSWWMNYIYHNGEAYDCKYYRRNSNGPDELELLYFGGKKEEVLREWNEENIERFNGSVHADDYDYDESPNFSEGNY